MEYQLQSDYYEEALNIEIVYYATGEIIVLIRHICGEEDTLHNEHFFFWSPYSKNIHQLTTVA